jgi:hypothetical protein
MTTTPTPAPIGPVLDTTTAPADARRVEQLKPDLLLSQEHHMAPDAASRSCCGVRWTSTSSRRSTAARPRWRPA